MLENLKSVARSQEAFLVVLICLVGLTSYGLGRMSVQPDRLTSTNAQSAGVVFVDVSSIVVDEDAQAVVASRSGTKYHRLDCPGAQTIKEANLIRFASAELARAAGYSPAGNCPGLE